MADPNVIAARGATAIEVNKVLRNTYMLLGMTLAFSALMAYVAMAINAPYLGLWTLLGWFALLYVVHKTADSAWGLFWVFAFTGFLGFTIGPVVSYYLQMPNGAWVVYRWEIRMPLLGVERITGPNMRRSERAVAPELEVVEAIAVGELEINLAKRKVEVGFFQMHKNCSEMPFRRKIILRCFLANQNLKT